MSLSGAVQVRENHPSIEDVPSTFENDGYELNAHLYQQYKLDADLYQHKNSTNGRKNQVHIFDIRGRRVHIAFSDLKHTRSLYYALPQDALPKTQNYENPLAVKRKAFARIVDGEIQTIKEFFPYFPDKSM